MNDSDAQIRLSATPPPTDTNTLPFHFDEFNQDRITIELEVASTKSSRRDVDSFSTGQTIIFDNNTNDLVALRQGDRILAYVELLVTDGKIAISIAERFPVKRAV